MKKRAFWIIAILVILIVALGVTGYATGWFISAPVVSINGDGSVTTTLEDMSEFPEDCEPNDSAIELPDMDFE